MITIQLNHILLDTMINYRIGHTNVYKSPKWIIEVNPSSQTATITGNLGTRYFTTEYLESLLSDKTISITLKPSRKGQIKRELTWRKAYIEYLYSEEQKSQPGPYKGSKY